MKYFLKAFFQACCLLLMIFCASVYLLMYARWKAPHVQSPFEAAAMLQNAMETDGRSIRFRSEEIDLDEIYKALEAQYPYAFSLHAITGTFNHVTELRVELSRPARQQQAWQYAKALAQECTTNTMTETEKLRALHDALIELCQYDVDAAKELTPDGATAPFAADGALIDHKAVCSGYGRAYHMLCEAAGIPGMAYVSSEEMNHGWNAIRRNGVTYFIDCTFDDPVSDHGEYVLEQYFMLTSEQLSQTHTWNQDFYEQMFDYMNDSK